MPMMRAVGSVGGALRTTSTRVPMWMVLSIFDAALLGWTLKGLPSM